MDSKVLFTKNLKWVANLVNGSVQIMKNIIHDENRTPANNLPMYFMSDFGYTYTNKRFLWR